MAKLVWLMPDSLRRDFVGCYGAPGITPVVDEVFAGGVRFDEAISQSSFTPISVASFLSGLYPHNTGFCTYRLQSSREPGHDLEPVFSGYSETALPRNLRTVFDILSQQGYATLAIVQPVLGKGFDYSCWNREDEPEAIGTVRARSLTFPAKTLLDWIRTHRDDDFVVFVRDNATHPPWLEDRGEYDEFEKYIGVISSSIITRKDEILIRLIRGAVSRFEQKWLKPIVDTLAELKILDETLLVLHSDHGDTLWEARELGEVDNLARVFLHTFNVYEAALRVPLLMRYPQKIPAGTLVRGTAQLVDVLPTVLDLLEVPVHEEMFDGNSLVSCLHGEDAPSLYTFSNSYRYVVVRGEGYKLIYDLDQGKHELYHLGENGVESENIFWREREIGRKLERVMMEEILRKSLAGRASAVRSDEEKMLDLFKDLGYL